MSIEKKLIEALEDFAKRLESGEDIEVTKVTRVDTPDGPMYVREEEFLDHERRNSE